MKKAVRSARIRNCLLIYVMFSILFPFGLFAQDPQNYKAPRTSMSYFVEEIGAKGVAIVSPPEPILEDKEIQPVTAEPEKILPMSESADAKFDLTWQEAEPVSSSPVPEPEKKKVDRKAEKATRQAKAPIIVQIAKAPAESSKTEPKKIEVKTKPFSDTLARMQRKSSSRQEEAAKLGIVLPSQGGDISAVSPSLSKINAAVKEIINRHKCPSHGNCNFCK